MIRKLRLLRSIGQFDAVGTGAHYELQKLTLVYAENARGKTTLAAIMRSLATGDSLSITERARLGAAHSPEVIIECAGGASPACFQNGAWSRTYDDLLVFDDAFVDTNVYSGMDVAAEHRQNLHELVLGQDGVALARRVDELAANIREYSKAIRDKADAIPAADRHGLPIDDFCKLATRSDIDEAIQLAEQRLTAVQNAEAVRRTPEFASLALPKIDFDHIEALLTRTVAELDATAARAVAEHFATLGDGGEGWIGTGMRLGRKEEPFDQKDDCPFCGQPLSDSELFVHYRAYFGQAYRALQAELAAAQLRIESALKGDALAGFERQVSAALERRAFWSTMTKVPELSLDTTAIASAWQQVRDTLIAAINTKRSDPLSALALDEDTKGKIRAFQSAVEDVALANSALTACNEDIKLVKENAASASATAAEAELKRLRAAKARQSPEIALACQAYSDAKAMKEAAEKKKAKAQTDLDKHRAASFPNMQTSVNTYLARLGAGFTLVKIKPQSTGGRPSCIYQLLINGHEVPVGSKLPPGASGFKNTLSAGDRNTLALAFFLATLDQDPKREQRVVVLDDPMSSLDKHRRLQTIQEIRTLLPQVAQVIIMSHDEYFLFDTYNRVAPKTRRPTAVVDTTCLAVSRGHAGSTIGAWDIESEMLGGHDRRHALLVDYIANNNQDRLKVAQCIRPHLEHYLRAACPDKFKRGETIGDFRKRAVAARDTGAPIIVNDKLSELDQLVEFSNEFHHDTNPAADSAVVTDGQLTPYVKRLLQFVSV